MVFCLLLLLLFLLFTLTLSPLPSFPLTIFIPLLSSSYCHHSCMLSFLSLYFLCLLLFSVSLFFAFPYLPCLIFLSSPSVLSSLCCLLQCHYFFHHLSCIFYISFCPFSFGSPHVSFPLFFYFSFIFSFFLIYSLPTSLTFLLLSHLSSFLPCNLISSSPLLILSLILLSHLYLSHPSLLTSSLHPCFSSLPES